MVFTGKVMWTAPYESSSYDRVMVDVYKPFRQRGGRLNQVHAIWTPSSSEKCGVEFEPKAYLFYGDWTKVDGEQRLTVNSCSPTVAMVDAPNAVQCLRDLDAGHGALYQGACLLTSDQDVLLRTYLEVDKRSPGVVKRISKVWSRCHEHNPDPESVVEVEVEAIPNEGLKLGSVRRFPKGASEGQEVTNAELLTCYKEELAWWSESHLVLREFRTRFYMPINLSAAAVSHR